jgi:AraC family ethanolamine operon transcriptional activator
MGLFRDYDAWGDAISGASLRLACDAVETNLWTLDRIDLGGVALQVATEGGGSLCYGGNTQTGALFFVPLTRANEQVVNGESLDNESLFVIPSGADFRIRVRRRAHSWCAIHFPSDVMEPLTPGTVSNRIACRPGAVPRLTQIVTEIAAALLSLPSDTAAHSAAGRDLVDAAAACLSVPAPSRAAQGRPRLNRAEIIRNAMSVIEASPTMPTAKELASHVGVTDRTLLRTFQEAYGVPPKRYLMLRELHHIRRILRASTTHDATVTDVLSRNGIWEFGRFAARYRRQFGELPSETVRRVRA